MRKIYSKELQEIKNYFKKTLSIDISSELDKYHLFVINSKIFFVHKKNKLFENFLATHSAKLLTYILALGLYFGDISSENVIIPTLEGYCLFANLVKKSYLVLNETGEQMFLYGRSILYEGLAYFRAPIKKNRIIYVFNKNLECLGVAKSVVNDKYIRNIKNLHALIAKPLYDKGLYIRSSGNMFKL